MDTNELIIDAEVSNLPQVIGFIEEQLESVHCGPKDLMQVGVAVEEVFVNIAHYAYAPGKGQAAVRVEVSDDPSYILITFSDCGSPFDPLSRQDPDVGVPVSDREIGGLGIFMTKKLMDDVTYEYKDGKNILKLKKKL